MGDELKPWLEDIRGEQVLPLVESDAKYIRVEAGPGTGKTFGLIRRVERILHPNGLNVPGSDVLVVAFNRVIANQLESEINDRLAQSSFGGQGPIIKTIHALCMSVSNVNRLLMPHEVEAMLYDVVSMNPRLAERFPRHDKIEQALRDHEAGHSQDPELWNECKRWLVRHKANLISDLPGLLLERIRAGDLPEYRYKHIVVDEFQDLTHGEQQLMQKLLRNDGCLTALGDPRQSIYHFRGNDLEGLSKLEELTGSNVEDVRITECQRCPASIVEAANNLMADHSAAPMVPISTAEANNHVVAWNNLGKEIEGMAAAIDANVTKFPEARHLIMVTRRNYGYRLGEQLELINPSLAVNISFSEGVLEAWPAREAFLTLCLLAAPDAATWRAWFAYQQPDTNGNFKAPKRNAAAYLDLLIKSEDTITSDIVRAVAAETIAVHGYGKSHIVERSKRFVELAGRFESHEPAELLSTIFDVVHWELERCREPVTARINLEQLMSTALSSLEDIKFNESDITNDQLLIKVVNRLRGQIAMKEPLATADGPTVQIATLWSAKGVTADHVYVLGLNKEMIPGKRRDDYPGTDAEYYDEQKRLFYVTLTRSKKTLVLSRSQKLKRQEARSMGITVDNPESLWPALSVSPFLSQVMSLLPDGVQGDQWRGC